MSAQPMAQAPQPPPTPTLPTSPTPTAAAPAPTAPTSEASPWTIEGRGRRSPAAVTRPYHRDGGRVRSEHRDLSDAVATLPGVTVERVGGVGTATVVRVRGATPAQTTWALDGVPLPAPTGQPFDLESLPLGLIASVAVHPSAPPLTLGPQAMGGAVDLHLRDPAPSQIRLGLGNPGAAFAEGVVGWAGGAQADQGPAGGPGKVSAAGPAAPRRWHGFAGVRWLHADNAFAYRDDAGTPWVASDDRTRTRANADVRRLGAAVGHSWRGDRVRVRLRALSEDRAQGLPGAASAPALRARLWQQRHDLWVIADGEGAPGGWMTQAVATWQRSAVTDPAAELGARRPGALDVRGGEVTGLWRRRARAAWQPSLRIAARGGQVGGRRDSGAVLLPASHQLAGDVTAAAPWRLREGSFIVEPRASIATARSLRTSDPAWTGAAAVDRTGWRPLPQARAGLRWRPAEALLLHAGASWSRRAPHLLELFGDDGAVRGNPALRDEQGVGVDGSADVLLRRGSWLLALRAAAAWMQHRDLIQLTRVSPTTALWLNVGAAAQTTLETEASLGHPAVGTLELQATWRRARDLGDDPAYHDRALPLLPATQGLVTLRSRAWQRADVALSAWTRGRWRAGRFADRANLIALPARSRVDAGIVARWRSFHLTLQIDNIGDAADDDLLGFPLPGRTLLVTLAAAAPPPATAEGAP